MQGPKTDEELQTYGKDFTKSLIEDSFNKINEAKKEFGSEFTHGVTLNLLASLVCTLVLNKLKTIPDGLGEDDVAREYQVYKTAIQSSISSGFEGAFVEFTGDSVDYYTEINPIPESASKYLN